MLNLLLIISVLILIIAIGLAVFSVTIIKKYLFNPRMYVSLGVVYFLLLVMGSLVLLVSLFLGGDPSGDFIPPSFLLMCPMTIAIPLSVLTLIILSVRTYIKDDKKNDRQSISTIFVYVINGFLIPSFLIGLPSLIIGPMEPRCELKNQETGKQIIAAVKDYHEIHGDYPDHMDNLIPLYFSSVPEDHCDPFDIRDYYIKECSNEVVLLTIETMTRDRYQRFNFQSNIWSESPLPVGDWLDFDKWDTICDGLE